jgi:quinoprotein glucose dehydrogenase
MKTPFLRRSAVISISALSVAVLSNVASQTLTLEQVERLPTPVVDEASDAAEKAIGHFTLPKGLEVKLWAAEPMLANPVAFDVDERGRVFVSETYRYRSSVLDIRDYMGMLELDLASRSIEDRTAFTRKVFGEEAFKQFSIESEVVRLVEDKDRDGKADASSIFADGFNTDLDGIASGVLARRGKVWFTNIPSLWLLEEKAGAKPARQELLRGFGVRYNFTGHDFHGLALGHDGKIYFSIGDRGANVKGKEGQVIAVPDEGAVFRANLDGSEFELFARGLRNPQELVFDEHGNLFTGDNDSDQTDMERLVYLVEGGDSGWRVGYQHAPLGRGGPWIRDGLWKPEFSGRPAYLLPPVCNIEDGPSGLTYYPGTGLTPEYRGHFFITHFKGTIVRSGIQTYTIKEKGASFAPTSSAQFMGGLLPTDVTFGPDGALWLSDWVEGWPKSHKCRIYRVVPQEQTDAQRAENAALAQLLAEGFAQRDVPALVKLLAHADRRARLEAQLELAARGEPAVAALIKLARNAKAPHLARIHAVWGLTQLGRNPQFDKIPPLLLKLLADKDAEVRAQSAKGLGDLGSALALEPLVKALGDAAPRVQFFAAQSLGKLRNAAATPALVALLERNANADAYVRHAASHALARIGRNAELDNGAKSASSAARLGVLLALRELRDASIAQFLGDADRYVAREAALAVNDAPITGAMAQLAATLDKAPVNDEPAVLRAINANLLQGSAAHARALVAYAGRADALPAMRAEALTQIGHWATVPQRDRIVGVFRPQPARDGAPAVAALKEAAPALLADAPPPVQLAAIAAIEALRLRDSAGTLAAVVGKDAATPEVRIAALKALDALEAPALTQALEAADKASVQALRLTGLQIAARRAPERALPTVRRFMTGSETEQQAAFLALAQVQRPESAQLLLLGLERQANGLVAPGAQVELLEAVEKSTAPSVQARWEKLKAQWAAGADALAPYRSALAGGDPRRGARSFFDHAVLPCVRCHKVSGNGGEAGPDLTTIGKQQTAEYLLEAVIKPNAHIAKGFDTPSSMPEIYAQVMSRAELRDLVAFLTRLEGRWPGEDAPPAASKPRAMNNATEAAAGGHP